MIWIMTLIVLCENSHNYKVVNIDEIGAFFFFKFQFSDLGLVF